MEQKDPLDRQLSLTAASQQEELQLKVSIIFLFTRGLVFFSGFTKGIKAVFLMFLSSLPETYLDLCSKNIKNRKDLVPICQRERQATCATECVKAISIF